MLELMKNWLRLIVLLPAIILLLGLAVIYVGSEMRLHTDQPPTAFNMVLKNDQVTLNKGQHAMRIRGCFGCHGQQLQGRVFTEQWPWVKRAVAPNLSLYARRHDVATFERAIRHGIGADNKAMYSMPSYNFKHLHDDDLTAMYAYMRSAPVVKQDLPSPSLGWSARWALLMGDYEHAADRVKKVPALTIDPRLNPDMARAEYLAMTTCNECHGLDLRGEQLPDFTAPDLAVMMKAYSESDFRKLMKTGTALGGRENLPLMSMVAKDRFAYFTEQELTDLYGFLNRLSE